MLLNALPGVKATRSAERAARRKGHEVGGGEVVGQHHGIGVGELPRYLGELLGSDERSAATPEIERPRDVVALHNLAQPLPEVKLAGVALYCDAGRGLCC